MIHRKDIPIDEVNEADFKVDLDKDGKLAMASKVVFRWNPVKGERMSFVGQAKALQERGELHLAEGLFPEGTEFLHSVRYLDIQGEKVVMAPRMKELRYARKQFWVNYASLSQAAGALIRKKDAKPDAAERYDGDAEVGLSTGTGWVFQGFIEDKAGELRPQTHEETQFCMGCHSAMGSSTDSTFAFARKLSSEHYRGAWYHWTQHGLQDVEDAPLADGLTEYAYYLEHTGAGDEFRSNQELMQAFFVEKDGRMQLSDASVASGWKKSISQLIFPSPERALALNKAYWLIVKEQSFVDGRDTVLGPVKNVHADIGDLEETGLEILLWPKSD